MKKVTIEGMKCENCAKKVKKALEGLDGVVNTVIDLEAKTAKIDTSYDIENNVIKNAIDRTGFTVVAIKDC